MTWRQVKDSTFEQFVREYSDGEPVNVKTILKTKLKAWIRQHGLENRFRQPQQQQQVRRRYNTDACIVSCKRRGSITGNELRAKGGRRVLLHDAICVISSSYLLQSVFDVFKLLALLLMGSITGNELRAKRRETAGCYCPIRSSAHNEKTQTPNTLCSR